MDHGTAKEYALIALALLLGALALTGCTYQVRAFFFTGVPEPGQQEVVEDDSSAVQRDSRDRVRSNPNFVHGPYGAGSCSLCHEGAGSSTFTQTGSAESAPPQSVSPRLVQPLAELCVGCHSDRHSPRGGAATTWLHGPVANGECTACHSPHQTAQRYMLLEDNGPALCGQCQDPAAECMGCHNAHSGQSPLLLKADYDERSRFDQG
jgi:predicted CXXCH cytochrome family protein